MIDHNTTIVTCDNCLKKSEIHSNSQTYTVEGITYYKTPCPHCQEEALVKEQCEKDSK